MTPVLRLTPVDWGCTVPPSPEGGPHAEGRPSRSLEGRRGAHRPGGDRRQPASGRCSLGDGAVPSPWLPPLPALVSPQDLRFANGPSAHGEVIIGLADRPAQQWQEPLCWDLSCHGTGLVVGTNGSGRPACSAWWQSRQHAGSALANSTCMPWTADRADSKDCRSRSHTGAVVPRDDHARIERLVRRLAAEVTRRQCAWDSTAFIAVGGTSLRSSRERRSSGPDVAAGRRLGRRRADPRRSRPRRRQRPAAGPAAGRRWGYGRPSRATAGS